MNKSFLSFLLVLCTLNISAQTTRDSIEIIGNVQDGFTYEQIDDVRIEIMHPDSTLIVDTRSLVKNEGLRHFNGKYYNVAKRAPGALMLPLPAQYLFRFSKEGYAPKTVAVAMRTGKRETRLFLEPVFLEKIRKSKDRELGEATVTTSKVRMVVKGDTIVYNADAFQLANGSMLDGLIKLLPGFELRGGQITVNGQFVSNLLVNGEDFFKGDPRVALENLPAYMVNKVKVYRKEHEYSYITGPTEKSRLPLVVDVNLKREYSIGWIANAEAGYGLQDRYLGRLFGLRFTNNSRLALYGNANNTNDTREPGTSGEWNMQYVPSRRTELQTGGFEALVKDKKGKWKYTGNAKFFRQRSDNEGTQSAETFHPLASSTFNRLRWDNLQRNLKAETYHTYMHRFQESYIDLKLWGQYNHANSHGLTQGAEWTTKPAEAYRAAALDSLFGNIGSQQLVQHLLHRYQNRTRYKADTWQGSAEMYSFIKVPHTPDYINLTAKVQAQHVNGTDHSDYLLSYGAASAGNRPDDLRRHFATRPVFNIDTKVEAKYTFRKDYAKIDFYYLLDDHFNDADRSLYRFDLLDEAERPDFGQLPSSTEALRRSLDTNNSYSSRQNSLKNRWGVSSVFWLDKAYNHKIEVSPELHLLTDRLDYRRGQLDLHPSRTLARFAGTLRYGYTDDMEIQYQFSTSEPSLLSMQDYLDDVNPLNLYQGNPHLKHSLLHHITARYAKNDYRRDKRFSLQTYWKMVRRAVAQGMNYDESTGVRTFMPRNVDGNWAIGGTIDWNRPLDKKKQLLISSATRADYHNSVDYVSSRSSVRNLHLSEALKLSWRVKEMLFDLHLSGKYLHATSQRAQFTDINCFDFTYNIAAQVPLPGAIALRADATLLHRTGYSDKSMNDVRFVANASLTRQLFNGRMSITLEGYDIFQGLSNVQRSLNAQGIVETWQNSLPSYGMLRLTYKLSKQPKQK